MIKKNPFTTSSQEKNTLQEVDVSLSKSTLKRRFPERKYKGFCTEWREEKSMEKAWNSSWSKAHNNICETWWSSVMAWACMASSDTGSLVFCDDMTEDRSSRNNSEEEGYTLPRFSQMEQSWWRFIVKMDVDPKYTAKATQEFLKEKVEYSAMAKSIS